jgi:hypothetical protein
MRLANLLPSLILAPALSLSVVACGGNGDDDDNGGGDDVIMGADNQYVMDSLLLPTTATEANMYGLNLDNDPQNRPDNALGSILSALAGQSGDLDLQATLDEQVAQGDIIKADQLTTWPDAGMWIYLGDNANPAACTDADDMVCGNHLQGGASFDLHVDSPMGDESRLYADIIGGKLTAGPGNVTIQISLVDGGDNLTLNLIGTKVEIATISETGLIGGKLGGAITEKDLDTVVLPALAGIIDGVIAEDCDVNATPCCPDGSTGETLLDLFDEDPKDCMVTLEELQNNSLIASLLAPDVDLLNCPAEDSDPSECTYEPRVDGVEDSLSLGLGFSGVPANFTP